MNCYNCGAPQVDDSPFCLKCGSAWGWMCDCKNINPIEAKFCARCGRPKPQRRPAAPPDRPAVPRAFTGSPSFPPSPHRRTTMNIRLEFSEAQIMQLLEESRAMTGPTQAVITQDYIDRLFEKS